MADELKITPTENGPLHAAVIGQVTRMADGLAMETDGTARLCRCGGSSNKPFCDGTHARNGFTGDRDPGRVPDKLESYTSSDERITITDNRGLCAHAGVCTDNLAAAFRVSAEPFVDPDGATADEIAAVIDRCPSGALSYTLDSAAQPQFGGDPSVVFAPGGPYVVKGASELVAVDMAAGASTDRCALCRCGASQNKPFCSGKHWEIDFDEDAAEA